ncbi:hypothetical protein CVT24_006816 [Panaeolus cyanescens]|uniref:Uncharacterized protein n=1 Tax=Panaeolus cyanescens TaxID=181874 RepID=A0A409V9C4_9AGAR|nr:hypothetical protein CVT24_006816 [Panaeolus cyanescens]
MPSLRRTASSPSVRSSVRSSPYSSAALLTRAGNSNRRTSGSETSNRRVLADLEWWTVTDGQCSPSADQESDESIHVAPELVVHVDFAQGLDVTRVDTSVDYLSSSWDSTPHFLVGTNDETVPTEQLSSLTLTPQTPPQRFRALDSAASSLESSPEPFFGSLPTDIDGLSDFEQGFAAAPLSLLPTQRRVPSRNLPTILTRSFTFADCFSLKADYPKQYADFATSPLSSAPDFLN